MHSPSDFIKRTQFSPSRRKGRLADFASPLFYKIKAQLCGFDFERRSKGADAIFAEQAEMEYSGLCDDEGM